MPRRSTIPPTDLPSRQRWKHTNVMGEWTFGWGDLDRGIAESAFTIEARYATPFAHHFAIEMHGCIAIPTAGRRPHPELGAAPVHPSSCHRGDARLAAGGRPGHLEPDGWQLRIQGLSQGRAGRRPRRTRSSSGRSRSCSPPRRPSRPRNVKRAWSTARSGFDADGRLVFQDMAIDFLVGAYADISPRVVSKSGLHALAPYHTPNAQDPGTWHLHDHPPTTAFRGFGAVHTAFALEGQMDRAAAAMGRDPVELRLQNMRAKGAPSAHRETPVDGDWPGLLRMVAAGLGPICRGPTAWGGASRWGSRPASRPRRRPLASGFVTMATRWWKWGRPRWGRGRRRLSRTSQRHGWA